MPERIGDTKGKSVRFGTQASTNWVLTHADPVCVKIWENESSVSLLDTKVQKYATETLIEVQDSIILRFIKVRLDEMSTGYHIVAELPYNAW